MVNPLPAILIGGPPHAGKSVLTYNLTQALRRRNVPHYVLRATPDGEGDWSQEMDQNTAQLVRIKGDWTPEFVSRICADLERRPLPLLVDVGGKPRDEQMCLFRHCTHSLLLLHAHDNTVINRWLELTTMHNLIPLARIYSEQSGISTLLSSEPTIEGTLVDLERGMQRIQSELFAVLVERIQALFVSAAETVNTHLEAHPTERLINLDSLIQTWAPGTERWTSELMQRLLADLPAHTPLSVFGRGPSWLYGALAAHAGEARFSQFNARLGWVTPPPLEMSAREPAEIHIATYGNEHVTVLRLNILPKNLDYASSAYLPFPALPAGRGLIISGVLPQWLLTALVRLYKDIGVAWIAYHYPQDEQNRAVVMASFTDTQVLGDLVPLPSS